jgi:hypothetical protein
MLTDITTTLDKIYAEFYNLTDESELSNTSTHNGLKVRSANLKEVLTIERKLDDLTKAVKKFIAREKYEIESTLRQQREQLAQIEKILQQPQTFAEVVTTSACNVATIIEKYNNPKPKLYQIAHETCISAYEIDNVKKCHNFPGWWCYCVQTGRFHLSINGEILWATTCIINPIEKPPLKFIEHRSTNKSIKPENTNFYIPPETSPWSNDVRQLTNRMKFIPASQQLKPNDKYTYRVGSKDTLTDDLRYMEDSDYRLLQDISGNFILCWTAAIKVLNTRRSHIPV